MGPEEAAARAASVVMAIVETSVAHLFNPPMCITLKQINHAPRIGTTEVPTNQRGVVAWRLWRQNHVVVDAKMHRKFQEEGVEDGKDKQRVDGRARIAFAIQRKTRRRRTTKGGKPRGRSTAKRGSMSIDENRWEEV